NIGTAILKTATGGHQFTVDGWTGHADLQALSGSDTVNATKAASFTLKNSELDSTDGMVAALTNIGAANLTDTSGGKTFTVSGWTGAGLMKDTNAATDTIVASKGAGFTLTDSTLSDAADAMAIGLSGIHVANLTDTVGGSSFTVSGWTGTGTLAAALPDTLV